MSLIPLVGGLTLQFLSSVNVIRNLRSKNILMRVIETEIKGNSYIRTLRGIYVGMDNFASGANRYR